MNGKIVSVHPFISNSRLRVMVTTKTDKGEIEAFLPERELSVILPRSLFITDEETKTVLSVSAQIMETFVSILQRMTRGRYVRLWEKEGKWYAFFPRWRNIEMKDCCSAPARTKTADFAD